MHRSTTSIVRAGLAAALLATSALAGDPTFTYVDLGTLPGGSASVAYGLNDLGQVVGWSTIPSCTTSQGLECRRAYLWENGTMTELGVLSGDEDSFARAINNGGTIVGTSERDVLFGSGVYHAATWSGTTAVALPDLGAGQSFAHDINDAGTIVGHTPDPTTLRDTSVTWAGGAVTDVGATESHSYNRLFGISESGGMVGWAWNLFSPNDAIAFDGSKWGTIGGFGQFQNAEAYGVNDSGQVAGFQAFPSGSWNAAIWDVAMGGVVDAGKLPGLDTGELYAINESGEAVGRSYNSFDPNASSRAHYWDGTTLHDLNDFLPAGSPVVLIEAREINENGDIAGSAFVGGSLRAFLLERGPAWAQYDIAASPANTVDLDATGSSSIGQSLDVVATNVTGFATLFAVSLAPASYPVLGGIGLVDPFSLVLTRVRAVNAGSSVLTLPFPNDPGVVGIDLFVQTSSIVSLGPDVWELSNGLEIPICE